MKRWNWFGMNTDWSNEITNSGRARRMMIIFKLNEVGEYVTRGYLIPASIIIC
jgi:hypothetical protein